MVRNDPGLIKSKGELKPQPSRVRMDDRTLTLVSEEKLKTHSRHQDDIKSRKA